MSTSGTTGDPTLVPEKWGGGGGRPTIITRDFWGMGVRPGDHVALVLFTFRGPTYGLFQGLGTVPVLFDFDPAEMERFCELSLALPTDRALQLRVGAHQRGARRVRAARLRSRGRVRVVQGRRVRGRAAEPACACARRGVGRRAVRAHRHRRRHRRVRVPRARRPALLGGHRAGRGPRSRRHRRRGRRRAVRAGRDVAVQPHRAADPLPLRRRRAPHARSVRLRAHARAGVADRAQGRRDRRRRPAGAADRRVGRGRVGRRVRDGPVPGDPRRRAGRRLRLRVGYAPAYGTGGDACATTCAARCATAIGLEPDVELVPTRRCSSSVRRTRSRGSHRDDRRRCWGVGRYEDGDGRVTWEISDAEIQRDMGERGARARRLGVTGGDRVLFCSMLSEAGQFWPFVVGAMLVGRAALVRRRQRGRRGAGRDVHCGSSQYRAVLGVTGAILDGLDALGHSYADTFGVSTSSAPARRVRCGWSTPGWRRTTSWCAGRRSPIGVATRRARARRRRRVAARRRRDGRPRARHQPRPRATEFVRATDRGLRRARRRRHRSRDPREACMTRALISADNHVFEPVTLWQERLPARSAPEGRGSNARRLARDGDRGHARPQAHAGERRAAAAKPRSRTSSGSRRRRRRPRRAAEATWRSTA